MNSKNKNILIVDDNTDNLLVLEYLLKSAGHRVVIAQDGIEALELLSVPPPFDLIVSDVMMPRMDGYSLCKKCKNDKTLAGIPFVFYTATYTMENDEEFALSLGAEDFIVKPFEPSKLLERLEGLLKAK